MSSFGHNSQKISTKFLHKLKKRVSIDFEFEEMVEVLKQPFNNKLWISEIWAIYCNTVICVKNGFDILSTTKVAWFVGLLVEWNHTFHVTFPFFRITLISNPIHAFQPRTTFPFYKISRRRVTVIDKSKTNGFRLSHRNQRFV